MKQINQYEIVLVDLDPNIGSKMKKTRPCIVLSPNEMNRHLQTIVIAPITGSSKNYPTRVEIQYKITNGWIAIDQISTIYRVRIVKRLADLTDKDIKKVKNVIHQTHVA
ncbi:MAG: type II toxin-antitoxin system PemK/MazF family toxin [Cytophagales bacterium]|nr:type II toxin-antitoxin system PemK/MazF family toxin [Cytophagales bacterium]